MLLAACFLLGPADIRSMPANAHYVNQRAPLSPSPFQKLPVGSVRGKGWLKTQLDLQRDGYSGKLAEISKYLDPKNNAWLGTGDAAHAGWEELPYWLRGQVSLAYTNHDQAMIRQCGVWIESVLKSQQSDGWFGPVCNRDTKLGTPDLWPNMLMECVLQTYYDATGDKRVLALLSKYSDYLLALDDSELVDPRHYWHFHRVADQMASVAWLHNRTGEAKLLKLADRLHKRSSDWVTGIPNMHGVNFAQGFREPAEYALFSHNATHRDASVAGLRSFRKQFGQVPGGMYGADENARKGFTDPRQGTESCAIAEMLYSDELLLLMQGDTAWADRAEDVAFNQLPVTMTSDLKAIRYLSSGNMAVSDSPSKSPGIENGGPMFLMDPNDHRCCQHNMGMAWPYLTEHLWTATNGNGLAALIYGPSSVSATVGAGTKIQVEETTSYPFSDAVEFRFAPERPTRFPFSFRIPEWCGRARCGVNGKAVALTSDPLQTVTRIWKKGDQLVLRLPMRVETVSWPDRPGTLSVRRGPLWYSLKIQESYTRLARASGWPAFEIYPKSDWNYGLVQKPQFKVQQSPLRDGMQPFDLAHVPVTIKTQGRQIPEWGLDMYGLVMPLQKCPAKTTRAVEELTLIPMGAARLRVTVFPTVSPDGSGHTWRPSRRPKPMIPTTFSFRCWWDSERALSDGILPANAADETVPRFTWWDHKGTTEWVQYTFAEARRATRSRVYWYNDQPTGGCRPPESWKVQYKVADAWVDAEAQGTAQTTADGWSEASFAPVQAREFRLVAKLRDGFSAGILEWEVD